MSLKEIFELISTFGSNWQVYLVFIQAVIAAWKKLKEDLAVKEGTQMTFRVSPLSEAEEADLQRCMLALAPDESQEGRVALPSFKILREIAALIKAYPEVREIVSKLLPIIKAFV